MSDRFPRSVYGEGEEPDPRFSLANERTFLAWIRTSLALLAAGVALEVLDVPIDPGFRLASAAVFLGLAVLSVGQSWLGWMRTERAMRRGDPLPPPTVAPVLAGGIVIAVALIVLGFVL